MLALQRTRELPSNVDEFVHEIGEGLGRIYGPAAAREYVETAHPRLLTAMRHPHIEALVCLDGSDTAGLLWSTVRDGVGQVAFLHVLLRYAGQGVEDKLINETVAFLRGQGVHAIISECLCFGATDARTAYGVQGFQRIERLLMSAPLDADTLACEGPAQTLPCGADRYRSAAEVIAAAYDGHPDRLLHPDVHDVAAVARFLDSVDRGGYGRTRPQYLRLFMRGNQAAGAVVGCEAAPGTGFVLQVAVRPEFQGQGVGACLVRELAEEFRAAGLTRIALGVTLSNPAHRLYERLGFQPTYPVDAHVWWKEPVAGGW